MDRIATKLWHVENGTITTSLGNYTDYQRQLGRRAQMEAAAAKAEEKPAPQPARVEIEAADHAITAKGKPRRRTEADVQKRLAKVERSISQLEGRLNELNDAISIATIDQDMAAIATLGQEFENVQQELDGAYAEWEAISHAAGEVAVGSD
jgi:ATPase subunit of ABC transporter with duplicated ATPase domains